MSTCIIIPNYNMHEMTRKCVEYCDKYAGIEHETLVVDDGSDEPYDDPTSKILRLETNSGFTHAVNSGILWATGYDYVMILNNDTLPEQDFLKHLVEVMDKDETIAVAGSSRIYSYDPLKIEHWGADLSRGMVMMSDNHLDILSDCIWIPFCSVLIRTDVIREIGLLDKHMRNHSSDNDFCIRCLQAGYRVVYVPWSRVFHHHEITTKKYKIDPNNDQRVFLEKLMGFKNQEILSLMPLDYENGIYGKLIFETYKKK